MQTAFCALIEQPNVNLMIIKEKKVNGLREEFNISIAPFICWCWWTLKYVLTEGGEGDLHTQLVCSERERESFRTFRTTLNIRKMTKGRRG